MAIIKSQGLTVVSSIPTWTPVDNESTFAILDNSTTLYTWNGATWDTHVLTPVSNLAYDSVTWDGVTDIAPSQNAIRDLVEAMLAGNLPDGDYGDITVSGGGTVMTIDNDVVVFAKMQDIATDRLLGRDTAASGNVEELTVGGGIEFTGSGGIQRSALAGGDVTAPAGSAVLTIANDSVTLAKMAEMNTDKLLGRDTAGVGNPEEISLNATLEFTGSGSIQRAGIGGDVTIAAGSNTSLIPNDTITHAKYQNIATDTLLGRVTAASGDVEALPFSDYSQGLIDLTDEADFKAYVNLEIGTDVQAFDADLTAIAALGTAGISARTAADTWALRTITGTANEITVSQGDGVAGNPTISLPTTIDLSSKTSFAIPVSAAPTVNADGEIALDTTVTDFSHGVVKFFGTEEQFILSLPVAQLTSPVNGDVPMYNSTDDEFQLVQILQPTYIYKVTITQAGVANPSGVIAVNNLGEVPTLTRLDVGEYEAGVAGTQFTAGGKTIVLATLAIGATATQVQASWTAVNKISFSTFDSAGAPADLVGDMQLTVEVWP